MYNHRLLVIDDAIIHRKILCRVGEKAGFDTTEAGSFDEAARLLHDKEFDCITLDLSLGDRAGVEVLSLLSVNKCRVPIIIISGVVEEKNKQRATASGAVAFFPKPVNFDEMIKVIRATLSADAGPPPVAA